MSDKITGIGNAVILGGMTYLAGLSLQFSFNSSQSDAIYTKCTGVFCYIFCLSQWERIYVRAAFAQLVGLIYAIGGIPCMLVYDRIGLVAWTRWVFGLLFGGITLGGIIYIVRKMLWRMRR